MSDGRILVVDDDDSLRRVTQFQLEQEGYVVGVAGSGAEALAALGKSPFDVVVSDLSMPGMTGIELLKTLHTEYREISVIIVTAYGSIESAVEAMKAGAWDYITKPVNREELLLVIRRALAHRHLLEEVRTLREGINRKYGFENLIGNAGSLLSVLDQASRAAQSSATVIIHGETGTGKEMLAKAIHFNSPRKDKPFVTINCSAIPRDLMESDLFGHVKGAFTGALFHKKGKVELAQGGTVFFDEIGELSLDLQAKLLRLIQEGEIEKVGSAQVEKVDVRILAATHRNLQAMVEDGTFREDLYYRLAVIPLELPPLRDRVEDIPLLVQEFFAESRRKHNRNELVLPASLMPRFSQYRWPGNVRELENIVERLVVLAPGAEITLADLPEALRGGDVQRITDSIELSPQGVSLEGIEKELILWALKKAQWNQTQAAALLDISRKTFLYRMEKHGIPKEPPANLS